MRQVAFVQAKDELEAAIEETQNALRGLQGGDSTAAAEAEATVPQPPANSASQPGAEVRLPQNVVEPEADAEQLPKAANAGAQDTCEWAPAHRAQGTAAEGEPDFAALAQKYPELRPYVRVGRNRRGSIDFTNFEAARCCPYQFSPPFSQQHLALLTAALTHLLSVCGAALSQPCLNLIPTGLAPVLSQRKHGTPVMDCSVESTVVWRTSDAMSPTRVEAKAAGASTCACCRDTSIAAHIVILNSGRRQLTRALLADHFGIRGWWVPDAHLIPPVTNRANYIRWLAHLLTLCPGSSQVDSHGGNHHALGACHVPRNEGCGDSMRKEACTCCLFMFAMHFTWALLLPSLHALPNLLS